MITLTDDRTELYQWDTNRSVTVDAECTQVHFSNKIYGRSYDVDVVGNVAAIPDVLLQSNSPLNVWAFVGTPDDGYTKISKVFKVNRRNKPSDYVYDPPEKPSTEPKLVSWNDLTDKPFGEEKVYLIEPCSLEGRYSNGWYTYTHLYANDTFKGTYVVEINGVDYEDETIDIAGTKYLIVSTPNGDVKICVMYTDTEITSQFPIESFALKQKTIKLIPIEYIPVDEILGMLSTAEGVSF